MITRVRNREDTVGLNCNIQFKTFFFIMVVIMIITIITIILVVVNIAYSLTCVAMWTFMSRNSWTVLQERIPAVKKCLKKEELHQN